MLGDRMKDTLKTVLVVALIGLCILNTAISVYFCTRYRSDFQSMRTLEYQVRSLESSVGDRWGTRHVWLRIVSADRPAESSEFVLHLDANTNGLQRLQIPLWHETGHSVAAWVSECEPRDDLAKFDQFDVLPTADRGGIEVLAKPKSGQTIDMQFGVSILVQRFRETEQAQNGPANGSQPIRSETNSTSGAAGSRR